MIDEPLVAALAAGEAVVFVGAGVSVPSGLPLWRDLLVDLLAYAKKLLPTEDWRRAKKFLKEDDFLLAAEMLQRKLPKPVFESYMKKVFLSVTEPNDIHKSIARLPFSLAITTNFDTLLEAACRNKPCYTWRNTAAVFQAIRSREFAVVKLHGSVHDVESLRIGRTDYRNSTYENLEFNECLRALLTWKTFLFVGHSLKDSDLLALMDVARMRFGTKFGPHYAIMPRPEADEAFSAYLKDALSIETITYEVDRKASDGHTKHVVKILKELAGRVTKHKYETNGVGMKDFSTTRNQAAQFVLNETVPLTGSIRGEVCMIESDVDPRLIRVAVVSSRETPHIDPPPLYPGSVIHTVFLQINAMTGQDYIYIKKISNDAQELKDAGYVNARYLSCDSAVRSELAYPIVADGRRVGVLNLESDLEEAYTQDHIDVVGKVAQHLGQIYLQSERRRRASEPLGRYYNRPDEFAELLQHSRLIRTMNHDFLLYEIDYERKVLIAHHANDTDPFCWRFDEPSLAMQVFQERRNFFIPDTELALSTIGSTRVNKKGCDRYGISGPLFACPVRAGGQTEAVLVTWLKPTSDPRSEHRPKAKIEQWFWSSCGQVFRLSNLLASDVYESGSWRAREFLSAFYHSLDRIDRKQIWTKGKLRNPDFRDHIMYALMDALLHRTCGFRCVRIWRRASAAHRATAGAVALDGFEIVDSLTKVGAGAPGKERRGAYNKYWSNGQDIYCRYTTARFSHDPFARWQHHQMFGETDRNSEALDKDPDGSWIVAPIVRPRNFGETSELVGFISADSHDRSSGTPKDRPEPDTRVVTLQCRIMDLIAELARHVVAIDVPRSRAAGAS